MKKKTTKRWKQFYRKSRIQVGTQLHGMNSTIAEMKEEDDRYKPIRERITNMEKKILDMDEIHENRSDEPRGAHADQNQGKAVITGFHSETSEPEVIQPLKVSITEIGMTIENARIESRKADHTFFHSLQER